MSDERRTLPDAEKARAAEAIIRDRVYQTPLLPAFDLDLDGVAGQRLWLKAENLQPTGSFKVRGALHWLRTASPEELAPGLVTVSAGNHALALAWAAADSATAVTVVMPEGSSAYKIEGSRALGAEVIVHGDIGAAVALCGQLQREQGKTLVHPYNDARIMAGAATVALEILRQQPKVARILCPIGGGGLISGVGIVAKALKPDIELIGVEPAGAATMHNAWQHNDPDAALSEIDTVAVSLAPKVVGELTYRATRQVVDRIVTVRDSAIVEATRLLLTRGHIYVETGAAVTLAALLEGEVAAAPKRETVLIVTGGNMDLIELCGF